MNNLVVNKDELMMNSIRKGGLVELVSVFGV